MQPSTAPTDAPSALASITNRWGEVELCRPESKEFIVHRSQPEGAYNHHQSLTSLDGRLIATWSMGDRDEDMSGQRMVMSVSDDLGATWTVPRPIVGRQPGRLGHGVVTSEGIHIHEGKMVAYAGYYDLTHTGLLMYAAMGGQFDMENHDEAWHVDFRTDLYVSENGGETWTGPVNTIPRFVPNHVPQKLRSGRLIVPGNISWPYTDDPFGIDGWTNAALPRTPDGYDDGPGGFGYVCRHRDDDGNLCEASPYELDDGTIRMMLRTDHYRLACCESTDHGVTWSEPVMTQFTDAGSRHHFGRLPDGRFFALSTPKPRSVRTPLILATSTDGTDFNTHYVIGDDNNLLARLMGAHKYGRYGYPYLHLMGEHAFFIYSINKEDIAVTRVPLEEIGL